MGGNYIYYIYIYLISVTFVYNTFVIRIILHSRTWLVMSSQININTAFEQDLMEVKSTYPKDILILGPCLHFNPMNNTIRCVGKGLYKYPDILQVIYLQ